MSSAPASPASKTLGDRGKPTALKSVFRSEKASLQFSVGRIARFLKKGLYSQHVGSGSPVYLSVVLKYLVAEGMNCTHWCIAGLLDTWNQLLFAALMHGSYYKNPSRH